MNTFEIGKKGEKYAVHYLLANGYEIVQCNYYVLGGEIDIIARERLQRPERGRRPGRYTRELVFFEVKCRRGLGFGYPEESLTYKKRTNLKLAMFKYMKAKYYRGLFRFDVIAILMNSFDELKDLRHYKNVQLI